MQELETHDPVVIFGAFDRHNFGDLLFAHIAAKLFERNELIFAGLARRDMRVYGGHIVESLAQLAAQWGHQRGNQRVHVVHAGGEILTCSDWEAAVMLLPADEAQRIIARLDRHSDERRAWAHARTGLDALLPYMVSRAMFPRSASVTYLAAGGVEFDRLDAGMRAEALTKLAQADAVSVRDVHTRNMLAAAGIGARLMPDPAVMVAELLGSRIRARSEQSGVAQLRSAFPDGYLAVQFSADFGDDRTLGALARELDRVSRESGFGIVFFQAGAAPWHDDPACYERIAAKMKSTDTAIFRSLDLWDICAVIASARAYAGSSLHGRIVAMAFGLPRVNLVHPAHARDTTKQCAFAASWEPAGVPGSVGIDALAEAIFVALASEPAMLARTASRLVACYRREFARMREVMGLA